MGTTAFRVQGSASRERRPVIANPRHPSVQTDRPQASTRCDQQLIAGQAARSVEMRQPHRAFPSLAPGQSRGTGVFGKEIALDQPRSALPGFREELRRPTGAGAAGPAGPAAPQLSCAAVCRA